MTSLTITAKGQITLRRELLQYLGVGPGQQVVVDKLTNGAIALHAKPARGLDAFVGCLPAPRKALSVTQMNAHIADAWGGKAKT